MLTQSQTQSSAAAPSATRLKPGMSGVFLQRKCACGGSAGMSGECEECQEQRLSLQRYPRDRATLSRLLGPSDQSLTVASGNASSPQEKVSQRIQTKSAVYHQGDRLEEEADRVANQVTGGSIFANSLLSNDLTFTEPRIQRAAIEGGSSSEDTLAGPAPAETGVQPATGAKAQAAGASTSAGLIVEDDAIERGPGQMRKSEFLEQLRTTVCTAADAALAEEGQSTKGCPYIERWIQNFRGRSSQYLERAIRKYAPESGGVTSARDYIPFVVERVRRGVSRWATTGEITEVPEDLANQLPGAGIAGVLGSVASAIGGAISGVVSGLVGGLGKVVSGIGSFFTKARDGEVRATDNPSEIQTQLNSGSPLEGSVKARMESAFGHDFSEVRVHNDVTAANLSANLNARAFTIGKDIAFGTAEYRPGTPVGDALIAHELAHVVQQRSSNAAMAPISNHGSERSALEDDADEFAVEAVVAGMSGRRGGSSGVARSAMPRLKSGLQLQRCSGRERKLNIKDMGEKWRTQFLKKNFPPKDQSAASKIMEDMLESNELTFWDEEALKNDIFKRMETSKLMQATQNLYGVAFEYPNHPSAKKCLPNNEKGDKVNPRVNKAAEKYWGPAQEPQGLYHWELSDEGKKNAFEALRTLFTPQKSICDMTLIHCDFLASVVHFRTFAESIGVDEFNQRVRNGDIDVRLAWNGFQELEDVGWFHSSKSISLREVRPASEKDLVIGDHLIFWNHRAYDLINKNIHNAWRLENAILVRKKGKEDRFLGHGSGENSNATMREKLKTEYNDVVKIAEPIMARSMAKDPKTASAAVAEMNLKFPNLKQEAGEWKIKGKAFGKTFDEKLQRIKADDPDLTGLREPDDPSKMGCVKRPIEAPGESC